MNRLSGKLVSFRRRPPFEQLWFLPVWFLLGLCRFLILTVHFRRLAPRLGMQAGIAPWVPLLDERAESRARAISRVVLFASRYTPWESNCFPQAMAARILLGLYGVPYSLFFGLERDAAHMRAHAWVAAGRIAVTGGHSFGRFTVVSCFFSPVPAWRQS